MMTATSSLPPPPAIVIEPAVCVCISWPSSVPMALQAYCVHLRSWCLLCPFASMVFDHERKWTQQAQSADSIPPLGNNDKHGRDICLYGQPTEILVSLCPLRTGMAGYMSPGNKWSYKHSRNASYYISRKDKKNICYRSPFFPQRCHLFLHLFSAPSSGVLLQQHQRLLLHRI